MADAAHRRHRRGPHRAHARRLLAGQVPGAALAAVHDALRGRRARGGRGARRARGRQRARSCSRCRRRGGRDLREHGDARRPDRGGRARRARRSSARSRSRSTSWTSIARSTPSRGRACRSRSASTAASTPRTSLSARPWRRPGGEPHLVRITSRDPYPPPASYVRASGGIFLDMTIHDFDMARYVTGSEVVEVYARGAVRVDPSFAEAGDVDTAIVSLEHENGCLTTIDNSRQAVYGYDQRVEAFGSGGMAASENPLGTPGSCAPPRARARRPAGLLPRALHRELPARVGGVRGGRERRRGAAGGRGGRAGPAGDRPGGGALAPRGPAGARRGGRGGMTGRSLDGDPFLAQRLDGRVLVVTGGTQGLGRRSPRAPLASVPPGS